MADPSGRVDVVDGDTIHVGQVTVRLHGVDAPELAQTCARADGTVWRCGSWAAQEAERRFGGKSATCTTRDVDRYGRIVATCRVDGQDMGQVLVQNGIAFAFRQYSMAYDLDEKGAAIARRGLHAHDVMPPSQYRAQQRNAVASTDAPDAACPIKGNISGKGNRIYHMPGQRDYARTSIRTENGERWFCSEADARAAGWRRAMR
ncbi:thermonuclease family protein [Pseudoprimorskyibacter insulae]|nr:thermonuclease family protein [Pseudoprimorskyibacter insulae]